MEPARGRPRRSARRRVRAPRQRRRRAAQRGSRQEPARVPRPRRRAPAAPATGARAAGLPARAGNDRRRRRPRRYGRRGGADGGRPGAGAVRDGSGPVRHDVGAARRHSSTSPNATSTATSATLQAATPRRSRPSKALSRSRHRLYLSSSLFALPLAKTVTLTLGPGAEWLSVLTWSRGDGGDPGGVEPNPEAGTVVFPNLPAVQPSTVAGRPRPGWSRHSGPRSRATRRPLRVRSLSWHDDGRRARRRPHGGARRCEPRDRRTRSLRPVRRGGGRLRLRRGLRRGVHEAGGADRAPRRGRAGGRDPATRPGAVVAVLDGRRRLEGTRPVVVPGHAAGRGAGRRGSPTPRARSPHPVRASSSSTSRATGAAARSADTPPSGSRPS